MRRPLVVCGDVHGHLRLALLAWALEQQQTGVQLDAVLLCGDLGTFTPDCPPDKATVRHATENPCELEFLGTGRVIRLRPGSTGSSRPSMTEAWACARR